MGVGNNLWLYVKILLVVEALGVVRLLCDPAVSTEQPSVSERALDSVAADRVTRKYGAAVDRRLAAAGLHPLSVNPESLPKFADRPEPQACVAATLELKRWAFAVTRDPAYAAMDEVTRGAILAEAPDMCLAASQVRTAYPTWARAAGAHWARLFSHAPGVFLDLLIAAGLALVWRHLVKPWWIARSSKIVD